MTIGQTPETDNVQAYEPEENAENRQYLKNGVDFAKQTGQQIYEGANARGGVCGTAVTACDQIMGMTTTVVNAVLPESVLAWIPSTQTLDHYVDKADQHVDKALKTDQGKWIESTVIQTGTIVQEKATSIKNTAIQQVQAVHNMKDTVITKAADTFNSIVGEENAELIVDATTYTVGQSIELAQGQLEKVQKIPGKVSEGLAAIQKLPASAIATAFDLADYDGDGKVTMADLGNSAKHAYDTGTEVVRNKIDQGIDYFMPQVGEETPAEDNDETVDEATRVSLSSKFMQRLLGNIKGQYVGKQALALAVEASKYVTYLKGLELKGFPVPETGRENFQKVIDVAAIQVSVFKDALFKMFVQAKDTIDLESYKGEIYKPLENITPYFSRMAQERSIESVPFDVLNVAICMFGIKRGTPEVMHLTESIQKLLHAVFDVTMLFSKSDTNKDG